MPHRPVRPGRPRSVQATAFPVGRHCGAWEARSRSMAYLNVEEIEAALHTIAESYPEVTELIPLPNRTPEGRQSHALRIGPADAQAGNTVVVTGGMHAR